MTRITITFLFMVVLFLSGVLIGLNQASLGMIQMRGFSDHSFEEAVQTRKLNTGNYEVQVLGQGFQQVPIEAKQRTYQEIQTSHGLQKVAFAIEKSVKWVYNTVIFMIYQFVQAIF